MLTAFFKRKDTFALGVCNGCQMMSHLHDLIDPEVPTASAPAPRGARHWPNFVRNRSEQFEARQCMVEIVESPASKVWFGDMAGSRMPIAVAHGEGRAEFRKTGDREQCATKGLVAMRYVDNNGCATETFPANPNGSSGGSTAFTTDDGRVLIVSVGVTVAYYCH